MKRIPYSTIALLVLVLGTFKAQPASADLVPIWIDDILIFVGSKANPILFVTQVPVLNDFTSRGSTFGNHGASLESVPRGGDLMLRYPDGALRNLTREAGFGMDGMQGANAIAVREPTVHWSGSTAVFSRVVGAPTQRYEVAPYYWQMYEVTGLGRGQTASITKVPNQPALYNNVSPLYGTDDRILFTSDHPRNGQAYLYPQLDEYESAATVSGIWSLNPAVQGDLRLLNHTPSGAFSPSIDSFGRVVFIRWDHLQQDQQADADRAAPANPPNGSFTYADESAGALATTLRTDMFPETRADTPSGVFGPVNGYTNNLFTPWQINEDGTKEETLNHIGRHELSFGYMPPSFSSDPALSYYTNDALHANTKPIRMDGGLFHLREDPVKRGTYYAILAREFGSLTSNQIVKLSGGEPMSPNQMVLSNVTPMPTPNTNNLPGGRFRNPLPLVSGTLIASHTPTVAASAADMLDFRLKPLIPDSASGLYQAGSSLTGGIIKYANLEVCGQLRATNPGAGNLDGRPPAFAAVGAMVGANASAMDKSPAHRTSLWTASCDLRPSTYQALRIRSHLGLYGFSTVQHAPGELPRLRREGCGVKVEAVPWGCGKHQMTTAYVLFLAHWAKKLSWKDVALSFHTSWDKVCQAVEVVVAWGLEHRTLGPIQAMICTSDSTAKMGMPLDSH